ncbi:hypothetical protein Osc7112_6634 (plasmid) [Oscillatoria nigro-viridis PCC 7112]|uniref:Uncharacterized protein n=1 Tax=Phormidium nigroviride PCC 7112 TaxID=179408 RepID=K9VRP2_9CYAN|nr:hypothetical protein Osc7112_6634 [Oscillatoria nigro-viridis PCC 7112]
MPVALLCVPVLASEILFHHSTKTIMIGNLKFVAGQARLYHHQVNIANTKALAQQSSHLLDRDGLQP